MYKNSRKTLAIDEDPDLHINILDQKYHCASDVESIVLWPLIKGLNLKYYHLLELIYHKGHTFAETAKMMNMSEGTVKTKVRSTI